MKIIRLKRENPLLKQNAENSFIDRENQRPRVTPCRRRDTRYVMEIKRVRAL